VQNIIICSKYHISGMHNCNNNIYLYWQLDVKEAPEVVTDHPQWEFPEGEEVLEGDASELSEFTTDEDVEDAD
jgi:hypothetical protein